MGLKWIAAKSVGVPKTDWVNDFGGNRFLNLPKTFEALKISALLPCCVLTKCDTVFSEHPGIHASSQGHSGPVTAVSFHPASKETPAEVADLYLTSSYDWTCKLRSNKVIFTPKSIFSRTIWHDG